MPTNDAWLAWVGDVAYVRAGSALISAAVAAATWPRQHFLYFLPLPHGQSSLRPIFVHGFGRLLIGGCARDTHHPKSPELVCITLNRAVIVAPAVRKNLRFAEPSHYPPI